MSLLPAAFDQTTDQAFFVLLTIESQGALQPLRVVNNNEIVSSRGEDFLPYPFSITLLSDSAESRPQITLTIDNVDRAITRYVRETLQPPILTLEIILSGSPDTVERRIDFLRLSNVRYDALSVSGTLTPVDSLNRSVVRRFYDPVEFPDLHYV